MKIQRSTKNRKLKAELQAGHKDKAVEVPFNPTETWKIVTVPVSSGRKAHRVLATLNGSFL